MFYRKKNIFLLYCCFVQKYQLFTTGERNNQKIFSSRDLCVLKHS